MQYSVASSGCQRETAKRVFDAAYDPHTRVCVCIYYLRRKAFARNVGFMKSMKNKSIKRQHRI